jgi:hypothetical protein
MATEDRFTKAVVTTLAKRAANQCSNPDCGAITSGPSSEPHASVNVGEAAHIYGANPGSARYDLLMGSSDRGAISNAIWLCGNCHKLVDDDPTKYPAGLLFEWQREHERRIEAQVGKVAANIRKRYEERHLEEFGRLSYLAERLILEKGDYWEYLLTAEVLRFEMAPIVRRWNALKRGLYVKPATKIEKSELFSWASGRMNEIGLVIHAFGELTNTEFARAWGAPGVPGSDIEIVSTCRLFGEICQSTLAWEESVRFVRVDESFEKVQKLLVGIAGGVIDQATEIPEFLTKTISGRPTSGSYQLKLDVTLPDGWTERVEVEMNRAARALR